MIVVKETTEWSTDFQPNHILFLSNDRSKLLAYINSNTGKQVVLKTPIDFNPRYRTFEMIQKIDDEAQGIPVKSASGNVYYVTNDNGKWQCTCTGYKYHGTCKHIKHVKENNK